ncbi:dr1-associated corepressor homolog isoform X2 [Contarinia nasturtii]|nr:dr1-associated corepressor homolog isoform X2 [Contarinia nasturtii]
MGGFQSQESQQNQNFPNPWNSWQSPSDFSNQLPNNFANQDPGFTFSNQINGQNFNQNQSPQNTFGFVQNPINAIVPNSGTNQEINNVQGTLDQILQQRQPQQQQANQNQNQSGGNQETTTANPAIAQVIASLPYVECRANCITLSHYTPLCGSDNQTYYNEQKLQCANNCGRQLTNNWEEITGRRGSCTTGPRAP